MVNWWGVLDVWQKFCTTCVLYRHPLTPWPPLQPSNIHNHQQRLVSLGWVSEALYVLGMHSHWAAWSSALGSQLGLEASLRRLDAIASLLRCFPRLAPQGLPADVPGQALQGADEFLEYRARWQAQCAALLRDEALWAGGGNDADSCREVVRCMAGEQRDADAAARTWLELLVSRLLSEHAVIGRQADLLQLLRACVAARPPGGADDPRQRYLSLLVAGCRLDAQAALQLCSDGTSWLAAHAADALAAHAAGTRMG